MHPMARTTRSARITGPVCYQPSNGRNRRIPLGPCLVERGEGSQVDIVWGASGQHSALLPADVLAEAEQSGHLVMLDG
jgi:hypothetical protein